MRATVAIPRDAIVVQCGDVSVSLTPYIRKRLL